MAEAQITTVRAVTQHFGDDIELIAEMTHDFAASGDIEETLRRALAHIANSVGAEAASLFLIDAESGELVCHACFGPVDITSLRLAVDHGIVGRTVSENLPQIVRDVGEDPDFGGVVDAQTGFVTHSVLCAPMSVRGERLGAIELMNKRGGGFFHPADARLLKALAASAALAVINARLAAAMVEQERMRREIELAAEIQRAMLPTARPAESPLHGVNVPARSVSGDFFDILSLPGGRYAFSIGDVSGKGINAALLMAKTSSLFRCLAKTISSPGQLLAAVNQELCETGITGTFVTMVAGVYNAQTGRVVLANAGHEPPLLHRPGGGFEAVEAGCAPLGIAPDLIEGAAPERAFDLGDRCLYLFTDGMTEAAGPDGAMLGAEGAMAMIERLAALPPLGRLDAVVAALAPAGAVLKDDLTLLLVEAGR